MDATSSATDEIGKMYDETAGLSQIFIDGQEHLPYWFDDHDDTPAVEAAQRITRKVGDALGLRAGERVLDAGCGVGGPAVQLAQEFGVAVDGVTISAVQAVEATARAYGQGVQDRVAFHHGDYGWLDFGTGHFDAVVAMESLSHAADLPAVLAELARVLRPGGRLGISEITREALAGDKAAQFAKTFQVRQLLSGPEWIAALRAAGFDVEEHTQCGPRVYGMGLRYLDRADELADDLVARFGPDTVSELKSGYRDYFSWGDAIGYSVLAARKPYL
ncbi:class I SAM-dependent methyltransferase [Actinoplanes sp. LDG1-06]|uniref:Class I SAM-dependent methyltransferase n=1 Tax=Paractinoplanes ovalisporus TaxID=2810368 RepID=A0ABS2AJX0_9ACTN|nr:methyltransferase domain-containing protein [Actinoplanes ovalisporus]MBM2620143.1 class I SAM-dependent methyltransferase [Actinoplanes ovalisporus]